MATLKHLIETHLQAKGLSARTFADQAGMSYPTLLSLINKGNVPRKPEHREALRRALGVDTQQWAGVLASSGRDAIDLPSAGPLTLQQMVTKALYSQGFSEQTFAKASGIPYPTVLGITRKGAVPRTDTLKRLAGALGFDENEVDTAAARSKNVRRDSDAALAAPEEDIEPAPLDLNARVAAAARRRGSSIASWANAHELPYLSLMKLVGGAKPADGTDLRAKLDAALIADAPPEREALEPRARSPLHQALLSFVRGRSMTIKAFAESCNLSALTAARLIKHGALPGRATTHDKLRTLLGLDEAAYDKLLRQHEAAAPAESGLTDEADVAFEHSETEEIHADVLVASGEHGTALHPKRPHSDLDEMMGLIQRLSGSQRQALRQLIDTMLA